MQNFATVHCAVSEEIARRRISQLSNYYYIKRTSMEPSGGKQCQNPPLPLDACGPLSSTWMPGYNGMPPIHPKTAVHLRRSPPRSNTPILDWPHSPSQTTSKSIQRFCHSILSWQTDGQTDRHTHTQTDRWSGWQVSKNTMYACSDALIML